MKLFDSYVNKTGYIFETSLIQALVNQYFPNDPFRYVGYFC